jgi:hypothetical protein
VPNPNPAKQKTDWSKITLWLVGAAYALTAFFVAFGFWRPEYLRMFDFDSTRIINILLTLLVVTLFAERAAEVVSSVFVEPGTQNLKGEATKAKYNLKAAATRLSTLNEAIKKKQHSPTSAKLAGVDPKLAFDAQAARDACDRAKYDVAGARDKAADCEEKIARRRGQSVRLAAVLTFLLGIIVSIVGIRSLQQLVDPTAFNCLLSVAQRRFFVMADILITGALIGGGSTGIHSIMMVLTDTSERLRRNTRSDVEGE